MSYRVMVDENFHYMDSSHRYALGDFATYAEAFAVCKEIVDRFLRHEFVPGMAASALYFRYMMFGRNPSLVNCTDETEMQPGFSAWDYARQRCGELCEAPPQGPALEVRSTQTAGLMLAEPRSFFTSTARAGPTMTAGE